MEKKEVIIQKNDRRVEQINLFVCICPDVYWITEIFLFLFGAGRCNGNFGGSGKPDDLKYSIYSYSIIPSRWKTPYNVPDSYNCQNPFYVHGMLNDKKESKYALPIRKNGKLKSFFVFAKNNDSVAGSVFLHIWGCSM